MPANSSNNNSRPLATWKEKDSIQGEIVTVLVMILKGRGCCWAKKAGCTMCGYNDPAEEIDVTPEELVDQVKYAMEGYDGEPYVKIFTSGSFLDPVEIPNTTQDNIFKEIASINDKVRILVESRPEFVVEERISTLSGIIKDIEIAIGLESSSDRIRSNNIRKGFTWNDYLKAGEVIKKKNIKLKTYLILKPPLLSEKDSIDDCIRSIEDIAKVFPTSRVSINPMNIQKKTDVESLYRRGLYRPPWIWSLIEVLRQGVHISNGRVHLMSSPTAGGKDRGVHNCGKCDQDLLRTIEEFSFLNDPNVLNSLFHRCKVEWEEYLSLSSIGPIENSKD